ncbi:MAG: hypothetical protein WB678_09460, partial [Stellaceae bacterium]
PRPSTPIALTKPVTAQPMPSSSVKTRGYWRSPAYAEEAVATYRAAAYRACIITTWIAVSFDLIDKLRELALFGNNEAKEKIVLFDRWQEEIACGNLATLQRALNFERDLLGYVRDKFELIDGQQYIDLKRLQDDRNRCAHPTLQREGAPYQPTGEMARAHLCNAIIHLLQQPPVQGRSALAEVRKLIASDYFSRELEGAKKALTDNVLARPSDALVRGAVDEILFGFFEPGNTYYRNRHVYTALSAIVEIRRPVVEPRVVDQTRKIFRGLEDNHLPYAIALVVSVPECWRALVDVHRQKVVEYMLHGPIEMVASLAERAAGLDQLREAIAKRVKVSDVRQLALLMKGGLRELAVNRAIEEFCTCRSWASANFVGQFLIIPLLTNLTYDNVKTIVEASSIQGIDLRCSGGFAEFLTKVRKERIISEDHLDALLEANHLDERGNPHYD